MVCDGLFQREVGMAHHKAAEKHLRASKKRRQQHKAQKSMVRTSVKRVLMTEKKGEAKEELLAATSMLDTLARKGLMHRNTAARCKSRLSKRVSALPE